MGKWPHSMEILRFPTSDLILSSTFFISGYFLSPTILTLLGIPINQVTKILFAVLCLVPLLIFTAIRTTSFDIIVTNNNFHFYFRNKDYADKFADLN